MDIKFCGAATSVTGSCHLVACGDELFLLDCGQFQGSKAMEELNFADFGFDPADIDYMFLSHAHIDHSGRIPLLVKQGFRGNIYCTDATADLLEIMLKDSGYIHEKEAEWQNRKNERAGRPLVEPLYTYNDALDSLKYVVPVLYDQLIHVSDNVSVVFNEAGHILGSAIIEVFATEESEEGQRTSKLVFSGDLGMKGRPILRDAKRIKKADYLIMETTYGDRIHPPNQGSIEQLIEIVLKTVKRGGNVIIPSFAVGRTQELIYEFNRFYEAHDEYKKELDGVMVYVDSPMATSATEVFRRNAQVFDEETREYILKGDNPLDFKNLKFTRTSEESQMLNQNTEPKVIISASGMCDAGRIKHHLKHNMWNSKNSIVFVGYQAVGTLGRSILDGAHEVTIFGEKVQVEAEIHNLQGFSGHADREGLVEWLEGFQKVPKEIFLVHGEEEAKDSFAKLVKFRMGYDCTIIREVSEFTLEPGHGAMKHELMQELVVPEEILKVKAKIADIHDELEQILYNTQLAVDGEIHPERMREIKNIVLELEKQTINLGSQVSINKEENKG